MATIYLVRTDELPLQNHVHAWSNILSTWFCVAFKDVAQLELSSVTHFFVFIFVWQERKRVMPSSFKLSLKSWDHTLPSLLLPQP